MPAEVRKEMQISDAFSQLAFDAVAAMIVIIYCDTVFYQLHSLPQIIHLAPVESFISVLIDS